MRTTDLGGELRLGVPEIDLQHGLQLEHVRAFRVAVERDPADRTRAEALLDELRAHASAHFLGEQALMRQRAYPATEAHAREHERLLEELERLRRAFVEGSRPALLVAEAISLWLTVHIQTMDRAFADFLKASGESGGAAGS